MKGFTKVELAPGESKQVVFELDDRSFSIWDNGWKIPKGTYCISVGRNCEDICLTTEIVKAGVVETDLSDAVRDVSLWYSNLNGIPTKKDLERLLRREISEIPLKKGNFTMDNTVMEMKEYSLIMKIMYKVVERTVAKGFGGKVDYNNPEFCMMMCSAVDASLTGMKISGGMNNHVLEGMLEMANGHYLKGIITMMT